MQTHSTLFYHAALRYKERPLSDICLDNQVHTTAHIIYHARDNTIECSGLKKYSKQQKYLCELQTVRVTVDFVIETFFPNLFIKLINS